jgi:hypothetical protein
VSAWTSHDRREIKRIRSDLLAAMRQVSLLEEARPPLSAVDQELRALMAQTMVDLASMRLARFAKRRTK